MTAARVDPHALASQLDVILTHENGEAPHRAAGASSATEPFNLDDYPLVAAAIAMVTTPADRSADTYRVVAACVDAGLSVEQTRWAVRTRRDLAQRLDERKDDDVATSWNKIHTDRQARIHDTEWTDRITANGDTPAGQPDGDPGPDEPPPDTATTADVKHSGHLGMAIKLATQFRGKLLHVYRIGWHRWDGKRWAPDGDGGARRAVHAVIRRDRRKCEELPAEEREKRAKQIARYETASAISGILTEAAALTPFAAATDVIDADPWLLNCANGTLDLHTLQLRDHDPADRITKICRGAYHADAETPVWDVFLARVLPDEAVRGFVQRLAGLSLLGEVREHLLPILTGVGANGKGTLYKALLYAVGDYGRAAEPELFMHRDGAHPTGQMDLLGRRLVIVSETDEGRRLAEATMKRLTGGDPITARYMREN
uniref:DNA primase family protein n=1 Tax=Mycobacterium sp. TaxID=1785 RepID=UPI003F966C8C